MLVRRLFEFPPCSARAGKWNCCNRRAEPRPGIDQPKSGHLGKRWRHGPLNVSYGVNDDEGESCATLTASSRQALLVEMEQVCARVGLYGKVEAHDSARFRAISPRGIAISERPWVGVSRLAFRAVYQGRRVSQPILNQTEEAGSGNAGHPDQDAGL